MRNLRREIFGSDPDEALQLIRWAKDVAGLSDVALAKRMGVIPSTVQEYREGRKVRIGWGFIVKWLQACGFRVVVDA